MSSDPLNDETISRLFAAIDEVEFDERGSQTPNPLTLIDGVYLLGNKIGQGGMASVYQAQVDLQRFDITLLYAYAQVSGKDHKEKREKAEELSHQLKEQKLDRSTILNLIKAQSLPMPRQDVAIKVAMGHIDLLRFEAEWKNLICLKHPNLIQVYGGGIYQHRPYYAMELIRNIIPTQTILETFCLKDKLKILLQAALGVQHLHTSGIIHRDIKPSNLITYYDKDKSICTKVTDLGIAKDTDLSLEMTQSGAVLGSPYYMSPEQVSSSRDVDARSDIYSLGSTLYELLSGHKPYQDKNTVFEVISAISLGQQPQNLNSLNPNLPSELIEIVECAMNLKAEHRYQSTQEFIQDLQLYLTHEDVEVLECKCNELTPPEQHISKSIAFSFVKHNIKRSDLPIEQQPSPSETEWKLKLNINRTTIIMIVLICITPIGLFFIDRHFTQIEQLENQVHKIDHISHLVKETEIDDQYHLVNHYSIELIPPSPAKKFQFTLPINSIETLKTKGLELIEETEFNSTLQLSLDDVAQLKKPVLIELTSRSQNPISDDGLHFKFYDYHTSPSECQTILKYTFPKMAEFQFIHPQERFNRPTPNVFELKQTLNKNEAVECFINFNLTQQQKLENP